MSIFRPIPSTGKLPTVCVFDLDQTLMAGDSTVDWTKFLFKHGLVTDPHWREVDEEMKRRYHAGTLNIRDYLRDVVPSFGYLTLSALAPHITAFIDEYVRPTVYPEAYQTIAEAKALGMDLLIISATNSFLVEPIGKTVFGIERSLGVVLVIENDLLTGEIEGIPTFQEGKVLRLEQELIGLGKRMDEVVFFTDSRNDLPLAKVAGDCYCVNPDPVLKAQAQHHGWPILRWRVTD